MIHNLANILTFARLIMLPVLVLFFFIPAEWAAWACLYLYIFGAMTDFFDGWVARRFDQVSELGKLVDPIADKIFVITILIMLVAVDRISGIWVIPVLIILGREFVVAGLREYLGSRDVRLPVTDLAKWKTALQMIALGFLIVAPYIPLGYMIGLLSLSGAAALTVITGWNYLREGLKYL